MAELGELALVVVEAEVCEEARVHGRVQRADAPVEVLGIPRHVGDLGDGQAGVGDGLRGAAGRDDLDARLHERGRELDEPALVAHGDQRALHGHHVA